MPRKSQPSPRTGLRGPDGAPSFPGGRPSTAVEAAAGRDELPRDHRGFPMKGAALEGYKQRQADINEAVMARQTVESLARTVMVLASRLTGLPGPDAVRALMQQAGTDGLQHGAAVVRAAGHSVPAQQAAWQAEAPRQRQASATVGGGWEADPDHAPEVMEAIRRGASAWELNQIRTGVAARHQQAREQQQKQSGVMWRTRDGGELRDDTEPTPFQTSVVVRDWNEFPDHAPPTPAAQETAAPAAAEPSIWAER